jgi:hypothetical protein
MILKILDLPIFGQRDPNNICTHGQCFTRRAQISINYGYLIPNLI